MPWVASPLVIVACVVGSALVHWFDHVDAGDGSEEVGGESEAAVGALGPAVFDQALGAQLRQGPGHSAGVDAQVGGDAPGAGGGEGSAGRVEDGVEGDVFQHDPFEGAQPQAQRPALGAEIHQHLGSARGGAGAFEEAHQRPERDEDPPPEADAGQLAPGHHLLGVVAGDAEQPGGLGDRDDEAFVLRHRNLHRVNGATYEYRGWEYILATYGVHG
jgi:hypothetical protein